MTILVTLGEGPLAGGYVVHVLGVGTMWHRGPIRAAYDEGVSWYRRARLAHAEAATRPQREP
jgi:hypothetical protein